VLVTRYRDFISNRIYSTLIETQNINNYNAIANLHT
jgi:hypothetical protein